MVTDVSSAAPPMPRTSSHPLGVELSAVGDRRRRKRLLLVAGLSTLAAACVVLLFISVVVVRRRIRDGGGALGRGGGSFKLRATLAKSMSVAKQPVVFARELEDCEESKRHRIVTCLPDLVPQQAGVGGEINDGFEGEHGTTSNRQTAANQQPSPPAYKPA